MGQMNWSVSVSLASLSSLVLCITISQWAMKKIMCCEYDPKSAASVTKKIFDIIYSSFPKSMEHIHTHTHTHTHSHTETHTYTHTHTHRHTHTHMNGA
jgi:hypothetical protein